MEFYKSLEKEEHQAIRHLFPLVHHSCGTPRALDPAPMDTAFAMVMQDLSDDYYQKAMMTAGEARVVLERLAELHSHYWGSMEGRDRGSFWTLGRRRSEVWCGVLILCLLLWCGVFSGVELQPSRWREVGKCGELCWTGCRS